MSAELEYQRLRNTYYYEITSDEGYLKRDIGDFDFLIPPYPLVEHNNSQRAIFTLVGCVLGDQVAGQQLGQTTHFSLEINGLGGMSNNYNTTSAGGVAGQMVMMDKQFMIPNLFDEFSSTGTNNGDAVTVTTVPIQRISGAFDLTNPYKLVVGNPSGQILRFILRNSAGALLGANGALRTIVRFQIEILDAE